MSRPNEAQSVQTEAYVGFLAAAEHDRECYTGFGRFNIEFNIEPVSLGNSTLVAPALGSVTTNS